MRNPRWLLGLLLLALAGCSPLVVNGQEAAVRQQASAGPGDGWVEYTHPAWGISFRYPAAWTLSIPDFDKFATPPAEGVPEGYTYNPNIEYMRTLGHPISLYVPGKDGAPVSEAVIALDVFTLSPGTDLKDWMELRNHLGATENPLADETTVTAVDTAGLPFADVGDQVAYSVLENRAIHTEVVWVAKGELVFLFMNSNTDPQVKEQFFQLVASLQFDPAHLAAIRARAQFSGTEQQMQESIALLRPQPTPACDSVCCDQKAYAEMYPNPAGQEPSPLAAPAAELSSYSGQNGYGSAYPDFTVRYDPALWTLVAGVAGSSDTLESSVVVSCTVLLNIGPIGSPDIAHRMVGPYLWSVAATNNPRALQYSTQTADALSLFFGLIRPDVDFTERSAQCMSLAEAVIATADFVSR